MSLNCIECFFFAFALGLIAPLCLERSAVGDYRPCCQCAPFRGCPLTSQSSNGPS